MLKKRSASRQNAFLAAYENCGSVTHAAKAIRVSRQRHYRWMLEPDYAARFSEARILATAALEDEGVERAMRGVFVPNVYRGRFVYPQEDYVVKEAVIGPRGAIREPEVRAWRDKPGAKPYGIWHKSDALLMFLLRHWMPEKYGWRGAVELSGPQGDPIEIVQRLNAGRERARLAAIAADESDEHPKN